MAGQDGKMVPKKACGIEESQEESLPLAVRSRSPGCCGNAGPTHAPRDPEGKMAIVLVHGDSHESEPFSKGSIVLFGST